VINPVSAPTFLRQFALYSHLLSVAHIAWCWELLPLRFAFLIPAVCISSRIQLFRPYLQSESGWNGERGSRSMDRIAVASWLQEAADNRLCIQLCSSAESMATFRCFHSRFLFCPVRSMSFIQAAASLLMPIQIWRFSLSQQIFALLVLSLEH